MATIQRNLTIQDYLEILQRRKRWIIFPLIAGVLIAAAYSYSIPPIYRASTLILVERPKAPEGYVQSTVTQTIQERLRTINQQTTSRTNLDKIIKQFDLLDTEVKTVKNEGKWQKYLSSVRQYLMSLTKVKQLIMPSKTPAKSELASASDESGPISTEAMVNSMKANIDINVIGNDAFTIAYMGRDPTTVMNVTNMLAKLFIEENVRSREQEASETSKFLESELADAEKNLNEKDRDLKEFKTNHMGALPEQMSINISELERLRKDLATINEQISDRQDSLRDLEEGRLPRRSESAYTRQEVKVDPLTAKREALLNELAKLRAEYNENYPDIKVIKNELQDLDAAMMHGTTPSDAANRGRDKDNLSQKFGLRIQDINSELKSLREKQRTLTSQVAQYEKRIEQTFANEHRLSILVRDYKAAESQYGDLLQKTLNARSSENLEKWVKGERFKIVDPAIVPQKPYIPNRPRILLIGSVCGLAFGAGIVFLKEWSHPAFRKPEDLQGIVDVPTLALVARNSAIWKRDDNVMFLKQPESMITDQYRGLYTKLSQQSRGQGRTVFAISSAIKGEGKTVTALNIARVAAKDFGRKTLLIEGDLRDPKLSHYLGLSVKAGLVDVLLNGVDFRTALVSLYEERLEVFPAGKSLQNTLTLLSSRELKELVGKLKELYDIIIVDSPPILPLPDMAIFEEVVDNIILVVRAETTPREALGRAVDSLTTEKLLGIVLNDVPRLPARYYRYDYKRV